MIFLYLITPLLGTLRNYIKYKRLKILLFLRTPVTYFMINLLFQNQNIWKTHHVEKDGSFLSINHYYHCIMMIIMLKNKNI